MLVLMSVFGASSKPDAAGAASGITWPTAVSIPSALAVRVHVSGTRMTLTGRDSQASVFRVVDLRTWEAVEDLRGDLNQRGALAVLLAQLAEERFYDALRRQEPVAPPDQMDVDDVSTWSSMQVLAAMTAARWSLPLGLGGTPAEIRRVNGAFLTVAWGL
jgi:hypothetical protein